MGRREELQLVGGGDRATIGTTNEDLRHIACVFSWYIWDHYTKFGRPVDLVGHSMGGIIIRWALYATPRSGSAFPPNLFVPGVVMFNSPHFGALTGSNLTCLGCLQLKQLENDTSESTMQELEATGRNPQGTGGTGSTVWTIMRSNCDGEVAFSAINGMDALHKVWYYTPCYDHGSILYDDVRNHTTGSGAEADYCDTACPFDGSGTKFETVFIGGSYNASTYPRSMLRMVQALSDASPPWTQPNLLTNPGFNTGNFNYWQLWPNTNWAVYHANQVGNNPYEGSYFAATNTWQSGGSIFQDVSRTINTGDIYCASGQVGTQGTSGGASGTIALFFRYNTDEGASQSFSNLPAGDGNTWTPTQVCLKATRSHSSLRVQFYPTPNNPATLVVDDVRVYRFS